MARSNIATALIAIWVLAGSIGASYPQNNAADSERAIIAQSGFRATERGTTQSGDLKYPVVLLDPQLLGSNNLYPGFDAASFKSLLTFALSSTQVLDVFVSGSTLKAEMRPVVARLASYIQDSEDAGIWTGELTRPDGNIVRLGPVVVADGRGPRLESLRIISEMVTKALLHPIGTRRLSRLRAVCLEPTEKVGLTAAFEFRALLLAGLRRERVSVRSIDSVDECRVRAGTDPEEASLNGEIRTADTWSITPRLVQQRGERIPLPVFRGTDEEYIRERDAYVELIAKAVKAYLDECPAVSLSEAARTFDRSDTREIEGVAQGILDREGCPYLAAAILEHASIEGHGAILQTSRAYRQARQPAAAIRLLHRTLKDFVNRPDTASMREIVAELRQELAQAEFDQHHFSEAMENFKLAFDVKPFPAAHLKYAQAAYLTGDEEVASQQVHLALQRDRLDLETRILAIQLALDRAAVRDDTGSNTVNFQEALNHAIVASQVAPKGVSSIRSAAKDIADRASSTGPLLKENMEIAERALTLSLEGAEEDAMLLLTRGRVRIWLAGEDENLRLAALQDVQKASELAKNQSPQAPDLQVVDLELAEGYLLNSKFQDAARAAQRFLAERRDPASGADSYVPVAYLLKYASETFAGRNARLDRATENFLKQIQPYTSWPRLTSALSSRDKEKKTTFPLAEWNFGTFDQYVCHSKHQSRSAILHASQTLQTKLDSTREQYKCPTP